MKFWIKYIFSGLVLAFAYLLLLSDSAASFQIRQWLAERLVFSVQPESSPPLQGNLLPSYADTIAHSAPAVVSIQVITKGQVVRNPNPTSYEDMYLVNVATNVGSGVIVDPNGYLVTNYHVIKNAESIKVQLSDGRQKIASVVGIDPFTDLALLHIGLENLPVPLVNLERESRPGDVVFAVGNPYGRLEQTITMGIISATRSSEIGLPLMQIDAAIHPGNSGGALINAYGELVGITQIQLASRSSSAAQTGISFTIPYPIVQKIVADLMDDGKVSRGWLGFSANMATPQMQAQLAPDTLASGVGFIITELNENGPADLAGLKMYDFVAQVDGEDARSLRLVSDKLIQSKPGDKMKFTLYRNKQKMELELTVGEAPSLKEP